MQSSYTAHVSFDTRQIRSSTVVQEYAHKLDAPDKCGRSFCQKFLPSSLQGTIKCISYPMHERHLILKTRRRASDRVYK